MLLLSFLSVAFFPGGTEARIKKSGHARAGFGIAKQFFEKTEREDNFFLNVTTEEGERRRLYDLVGFDLFAEIFLANDWSLGVRGERFGKRTDFGKGFKRSNSLDQVLLQLHYSHTLESGIQSFESRDVAAGFGLGVGTATVRYELELPDSENRRSEHKGYVIQPTIHLDLGGYGLGLRGVVNYNFYFIEKKAVEGSDFDFKDDLNGIGIALEVRLGFYRKDPFSQ